MDQAEQPIEVAPVRTCSEYNKAPPGECAYCDRERASGNSFHPPHEASRNCCSGRRNHCSCDTCF